jgi:hypothetical protein
LTPASIRHAFANQRLAKALDIQFFNKDKAVCIGKLTAQFVAKVPALVGYLFVQLANLASEFPVWTTTLFASGTATLQDSQFRFRSSQPAGVFNYLPGGQSSENFQVHVNLDTWGWMCVQSPGHDVCKGY